MVAQKWEVPEELVTEDNFAFAMMTLKASAELGVDTETTGLNVRNKVDYLTGICVSVEGFDWYFPFRHPDYNLPRNYLDHLVEVLQEKDLDWHNMKFDYHSCATIGIDPLTFRGRQFDTNILAQLINEELFSKELDFLAKWYLKDEKSGKDGFHNLGKTFGYDQIPATLAAPYGAKDAQLTRRLKAFFWPKIIEQELEDVYWKTEEPFTKLLYKLETRGVGVNADHCEKLYERGTRRMGTIVRELGFSPSSPKQLGNYLLEELKLPVLKHTKSCGQCKAGFPVDSHSGPPSFDKMAMEDYDDILQASNNVSAQRVAEFRGWQKATSSLYLPLLKKVGPDGLIRTDFRHNGTVTGRISSSDPNLQQIPRGSDKPWNGRAKTSFRAYREGHVIYGWDYSQLELRIAASYGSERLLLTEFDKADADPFNVLAPLIFGTLNPDTRHQTKTFVYANLYGAGVAKIAAQLGRSISDTQALYENYKASIPGIISISSRVSKTVERRGYVRYWDGRRRHIRNRSDSYKAWNSVCQGGGAQLVKQAMLRCQEFEDENCFMVLQVHDEITFSIRQDLIPHYEPLIKKAMTDFPIGVHLAVDGKEWK